MGLAGIPDDNQALLQPLLGWEIAVTAERGGPEQIGLLQQRGARTLHGPMVNTRSFGPSGTLTALIDEIVTSPPDLLVLSNGYGLRSLLMAAETNGLLDDLRSAFGNAEVITQGHNAHKAAVAEGWDVSWSAPQASTAEVLDHLGAAGIAGRRVAVVLDGGDDARLDRELELLGATVTGIPVDRCELPEHVGPAQRLITAIAERAVDAVTFTSSSGVRNLLQLAGATDQLEAVRESLSGSVLIVSIGPACSSTIRDEGLDPAVESDRPRLDAMVAALSRRAVLRRRSVSAGGVEVLLDATNPVIDGAVLDMGPKERSVFKVLADRPGSVVAKVVLSQQVWGRSSDLHTVEVTVGRLRDRLRSATGGALQIETVPRRGYRLVGAPGSATEGPGTRQSGYTSSDPAC